MKGELRRLELLSGFFYYTLNIKSLQHAATLLQGFRSYELNPLLRTHAQALRNLRLLYSGSISDDRIKTEIRLYAEHTHSTENYFTIDSRTLDISCAFTRPDPAMLTALEKLNDLNELKIHSHKTAELSEPMFIFAEHGGEKRIYPIKHFPGSLPATARHEYGRQRKTNIDIAWADLLAEARDMDLIDSLQAQARAGNWEKRLQATQLSIPSADGKLLPSQLLTLHGLKHLIGLPGSGKTTLLVCLLRYLSRQKLKTAIFFPSIEVAKSYLEDLQRYGVNTGLLMGQSTSTRQRHAARLSEALAAGDPLKGFARSSTSANLIEGTCALPALTDAPSSAVSLEDSFCQTVLQRSERSDSGYAKRLCPAWSVCSAKKAVRELPNADVWLGHVLSANTTMAKHTTLFSEQYIEYIAREFDVVIFDEADKAQQDLDNSGIAELSLTGNKSSIHKYIQEQVLHATAAGKNAALKDDSYYKLVLECGVFESVSFALMSAIQQLHEELKKSLTGVLLTPRRLLERWHTTTKILQTTECLEEQEKQDQIRLFFSDMWEQSALRIYQTLNDLELAADTDVSRFAELFDLSLNDAQTLSDEITLHQSLWLNATNITVRRKSERELKDLLASILPNSNNVKHPMLVPLLLSVTFSIISFRHLKNSLVAQESLVAGPLAFSSPMRSSALTSATPSNLLGSIAGIRFFPQKTEAANASINQNIEIQYISFNGAPRALMYQLHEWLLTADGKSTGPSVLLTSATSYFPSSPSSHINISPTYLLHAPAARQQTTKSRYAFRPIPDLNARDTSNLRFSGVGEVDDGLRNLEKMVIALLDGGPTNSQLAKDCASFDEREGITRKAAFVVNSYEQSTALKAFIDQRFGEWRTHTIAVVKELPSDPNIKGYVTSAGVEALGDDTHWKILIFPLLALGRGTNIVATSGPRKLDAMIGTMYFLTRPHPTPNDLSLFTSLAAQLTQQFNDADLSSSHSIDDVVSAYKNARKNVYIRTSMLMSQPLYSRGLSPTLHQHFTANSAVPLLQAIGRGMRNGCPVQCFFVDCAWAEGANKQEKDTSISSMLVQLRNLLIEGTDSPDPKVALLFRELYGPFLQPLLEIKGMQMPTHRAEAPSSNHF